MGNSAVYPSSMTLQSLKWESIVNNNYGITLEMYDGRIFAEFDYYLNKTDDMFGYNQAIQSTSGYARTSIVNMGAMDNVGWDFSVKTMPVKQKDYSISFDFNIARNYNILQRLTDDYSTESTLTIGNGEFKNVSAIGNPAGSFYGYRYLGVYLNQDDLLAKDGQGELI